MTVTIFVPRDAAALALGAEKIAKAIMEQMQPELTQALQQKSLPLDGEASTDA